MKNSSLILQLILFVAVLVLYVLHFKGDTASQLPQGESSKSSLVPNTPMISGGVVFINSDSLLDNYSYFKNKKSQFEAKQDKIKSDLESESGKLQRDVESYQQRAPGMADMQRQIEEEQLMMRQQKLMQKKDQLLEQLDEEQAKTSEELYTRLSGFLKEYNKDKNYQFIFGFQKGGGILFANDSLDITGPVLHGLNEAYIKESK
ncbi:MAG: OmpH family outer membrane protein [Bacteroidia bacterium]|nr:OmpH family outer membrane protein [Bacteroidia bacterium]